MRKYFTHYLLSLLTILYIGMTGCRSAQYVDEDSELTVIKFGKMDKDFRISDQFSKISCVQLEMTDESVVGRIKKIVDADTALVVIDDASEITVFRKKDGKYLNHIGNRGEGPDEYLYAEDIAWDPQSKNIIVCDRIKNDFLSYRIDGTFVGRKNFGVDMREIHCMELASDGSIILSNDFCASDCASNPDHAFSILSENGETTEAAPFAPLYKEMGSTQWAQHPITACGNEMKFVPILSDTIYSVKDGKISARYLVATGYPVTSKEKLAQEGPFDLRYMDESIKKGENPGIDMLYETSRYIVYIPQTYFVTGFYWIDKTTDKGFFVSSTAEYTPQIRKVLEGWNILQIIGSNEDGMISQFDAMMGKFAFSQALEDGDDGIALPDDVISTIKNVDPDGNPFLIIYEH